MSDLFVSCYPDISIKLCRYMEVTCTTFPDLCSCSGRLMECFVLKELVVGMFKQRSVRLSSQPLSAIHKLSKLLRAKMVKWQKLAGAFIFIQIDCHDHHFLWKTRNCRSGFWDDCSLVHGNCNSLDRSMSYIPMSVQLQCIQNVTITVLLSPCRNLPRVCCSLE